MPPMDESRDRSDDQLHDQLISRYIPDDGFTARTLQRLPGPGRDWRRWVLGTATLLALVLATVLSPDLVILGAQLWRTTAAAAGSIAGGWPVVALAVAVALASALALLREEA